MTNHQQCCDLCKAFTQTGTYCTLTNPLCACHHPEQEGWVWENSDEAQWEKDFRAVWFKRHNGKLYSDVKSFIRSLLEKQRKEMEAYYKPLIGTFELKKLEERFEAGRAAAYKEIAEKVERLQQHRPVMEIGSHFYDAALTDILSLLTPNKYH